MNATPRIEPDPLVDELLPDPAAPQNIVALDGYLGRSAEEGHWRLYRDLSLTFWLEIPEEAIHRTETVMVPGDLHPLTVVWVGRDFELHTGTSAREDERWDFLRGSFTADALLAAETQPWAIASGSKIWIGHTCK
jgi:hypothetical protein